MMYSNAGNDCTDGGVGCGGGPQRDGPMTYTGPGQGGYIQETGYKYVGYGGDFGVARPRRDFTCLIASCCLLSLIPLLLWLLSCLLTTSQLFDCETNFATCQLRWSKRQEEFCCSTVGRCCMEPDRFEDPTPPPGPVGPVDPFNCADGALNWRSEWSVEKKEWCCKIHDKGCPANGEGWDAVPAAQYDCNAGFANWVKGWSIPKKVWCCNSAQKGCIGSGAMSEGQAENQGYGAGAQHGNFGAPVAAISGIRIAHR